MKKKLFVVFLIMVISAALRAREGMHLVNAITPELLADMKKVGLELKGEDIWDGRGQGLATAVVSLSGGTGSFVSPQGLILTNHHVAFDAVQRQSSPEHDYIRDGFQAERLDQEIPAPGYNALVMMDLIPVTEKYKAVFQTHLTPRQRYELIKKIGRELVGQAEKKRGLEYRVVEFYGGKEFYLIAYLRLRDIRLVYIPPRSIGEYGGEVDNWMWPRHCGDFSFLRAYGARDGFPTPYSKKNVPFKPKTYLKIAGQGLKEGDFTMILGYPSRTYRWLSVPAVANEFLYNYPLRIDLLKGQIAVVEERSKTSDAVRIKNAGLLKRFFNSLKNAAGIMAGQEKFQLLKAKRQAEKELQDFIEIDPQRKQKYGHLLASLERVYSEAHDLANQSTVEKTMLANVTMLNWASTIAKWTIEKDKKDSERETGFQQRDMVLKRERIKTSQSSLDPETDQALFAFYLKKILEKPKNQIPASLARALAQIEGQNPPEKISTWLQFLYSHTRLAEPETPFKMLDLKTKQLQAQEDALLDFAREFQKDLDAIEEKNKIISGSLAVLLPLYTELIMEFHKNQTFYPEANATLRLNYGKVEGYAPRDAVYYLPFTRLAGVIEKNSAKFPFDLDQRIIEANRAGDFGTYQAPELGDVPVNFTTSNDSTGGNSGSPVLNGRGELVGTLFDGNYEALGSDFFFRPEITRSINVDIRYVLFICDRIAKTGNLLKELGVK